MAYGRAVDVLAQTADLLLPLSREKPSVLAAKYLHDGKSFWDPETASDWIEPMDAIADRQYREIICVGPSRSSKSWSIMVGGINYALTAAAGDVLVVAMTEKAAHSVSTEDLGKAVENSPEWRARLREGKTADGVRTKKFDRLTVTIGHPAASQLSGNTQTYVFMPDYDNAPNAHDVGGRGPMFDLAKVRVRQALSRGKAVAEGNPAGEFYDPDWTPGTPHEAPPMRGLLSLYNGGTRARRYWPCKTCNKFFQAEPGYGLFRLPPVKELAEQIRGVNLLTWAEDHAIVFCPNCGVGHTMEDRPWMRKHAVWVHEGQKINHHGEVVGNRLRSWRASYWLGGVCAPFQSWTGMLVEYATAIETWRRTGEEASLRKVTNTDSASPYVPVDAKASRKASELKERTEDWPQGTVPEGVRYITAAADTQGSHWVVHVFGWGAGRECWLLDRFSIFQSRRKSALGDALPVDPAVYVEDWMLMAEMVADKSYPLVEDRRLSMRPSLTLVDSGGKSGVTLRAYEAWRQWRDRGYGSRIMLIKGGNKLDDPTIHESWPEAQGKGDRHTGAQGDVPVWILNVNQLKTAIYGDLARSEPGPGYVHLPKWMIEHDSKLFEEYCSEEKDNRGYWVVRSGMKRNEAPDLHGYARAACIILGADQINWQRPPAWALRPTAPELRPAALKPVHRGPSVKIHGRR